MKKKNVVTSTSSHILQRTVFHIILLLSLPGILFAIPAIALELGNDQLNISIHPIDRGMELAGIKQKGIPLLAEPSSLFNLTLQRLSDQSEFSVSSQNNWSQVSTGNDLSGYKIIFTKPENQVLPDTLMVTVTISVLGGRSQWNLSVSGIGSSFSLLEAVFPIMNIRAEGNDQFLIPQYSGVLIPNPVAENIDQELLYPRGWGATMPFLAYYNDDYGIYLGFHDPKASVKRFIARAEDGHIHFQGKFPIPDKIKADNAWKLEGNFVFNLFQGNWYEAAQIYKIWASQKAEYWPKMTLERIMSQHELGRIGIWGINAPNSSDSMERIKNDLETFISLFQTDLDIPVGIHWYRWNGKAFDDDYPDYFPERNGTSELISEIQYSENAYIMPYINGRLFDTDLTGLWDFRTRGRPDTTKQANNTIFTQDFAGNTFAVMCPTRENWQGIIANAAGQLTNRIGASGIYIDQVSAASPLECMDKTHTHPLGGGHWWRDGYQEMFSNIHDSIGLKSFIVVEGAADYMADQVDGFLTAGWLSNNMVPAFQAVYSGRVQLVGKATGTSTYGDQSFYCKLSQALVQGVQPGRLSVWLAQDNRPDYHADLARPFVKRIATMRYKLRKFLSHGYMLKPIPLHGSIPTITSSWTGYGDTPANVTINAVQSGLYQSRDKKSIAVILANASMTKSMKFSFDFDATKYHCSGKLNMHEIRESGETQPQKTPSEFTQNVTLPPLESIAYIIDNCREFPWPIFLPTINMNSKMTIQ